MKKEDLRREKEILDRGFREFMGYMDWPCEHGNRDVVIDDYGVVRMYCLDCKMTGWADFKGAQTLGWIEEE